MVVKRARFNALEIEDWTVNKLRVVEYQGPNSRGVAERNERFPARRHMIGSKNRRSHAASVLH
jgi:hypothetical protein